MFEALRAGASGFLLKDTLPDDLIAAVRVVAGGQALLAPTVTRRLIEEFVRRPAPARPAPLPGLDRLTERETEVLIAVARGLSNTEIADTLFISPATAKTHVCRLLTKLHARDRAQLVMLAYKPGWSPPGCPEPPGRVRPDRPAAGTCRSHRGRHWSNKTTSYWTRSGVPVPHIVLHAQLLWLLAKGRTMIRWLRLVLGVVGLALAGNVAVPGAAGAADDPQDDPAQGIAAVQTYFVGNVGDRVNLVSCLDVYDWGRGPWLQMWECHGGQNQQFRVDLASRGYQPIRNVASGQCIDGYWAFGQQLRQLPCDGTTSQDWQLVEVGTGIYEIKNRRRPDLCMDQRDWGRAREVQLWTCNGADNQRWYFD